MAPLLRMRTRGTRDYESRSDLITSDNNNLILQDFVHSNTMACKTLFAIVAVCAVVAFGQPVFQRCCKHLK